MALMRVINVPIKHPMLGNLTIEQEEELTFLQLGYPRQPKRRLAALGYF
jgi:hypothetical protein